MGTAEEMGSIPISLITHRELLATVDETRYERVQLDVVISTTNTTSSGDTVSVYGAFARWPQSAAGKLAAAYEEVAALRQRVQELEGSAAGTRTNGAEPVGGVIPTTDRNPQPSCRAAAQDGRCPTCQTVFRLGAAMRQHRLRAHGEMTRGDGLGEPHGHTESHTNSREPETSTTEDD